jgi:hypothetical protein
MGLGGFPNKRSRTPSEGWGVESIEPTRFEVWPDLKDVSDVVPKAWFSVVPRSGYPNRGGASRSA